MNSLFNHQIDCQPDFALLSVQIPANETLRVEGSSMATMDTNIKMKTKMKGGFKRLLTGESLFINEFTAQNGAGIIQIAPAPAGNIQHIFLDETTTIFLQNAAYLSSTMEVKTDIKFQGLIKGFFSGNGLFLIKCSGYGDLWFNSYGAMIEVEVTEEEDYIVDTGHIVGFTSSLEYQVTSCGGYKSLFFSGEGLVCRFSGRGKVWIQTRSAAPFAYWADQFRLTESKEDSAKES